MAMRTHELHPALVHMPLTLVPLAAAVDTAAVVTQGYELDRTGRTLWSAAAVSGLVTGIAGLAASQEVRVQERRARDKMYVHGIGNAVILQAVAGLALWRMRKRASVASTCLAWSAVGLAGYTAYLGGELVYQHGVGVEADDAPPLLSARAPRTLLTDALRGASWLLRSTLELASGRRRIGSGSLA
jgi:uncharacterized membrane protein